MASPGNGSTREDTGGETEWEREGEGEGEVPRRFEQDGFYRALAAAPRRRLLYYLLEEGAESVENLVTVLTGWETAERTTMATPSDRRRTALTLTHQHLPILTTAGLVEYDERRERVELAALDQRVADVIRWSVRAEKRAGDPEREPG